MAPGYGAWWRGESNRPRHNKNSRSRGLFVAPVDSTLAFAFLTPQALLSLLFKPQPNQESEGIARERPMGVNRNFGTADRILATAKQHGFSRGSTSHDNQSKEYTTLSSYPARHWFMLLLNTSRSRQEV
jgi:hypothetical protein